MTKKEGSRKRARVTAPVDEKSMTQQQFAKETDINNIMERYTRTGIIGNPGPGGRKPFFGDFSSIDFQSMQNQIIDVEHQFRSLPSRVRSRFRNEPLQLIRFVEDPANEAEAIRLGLISPRPRTVDEAYEAAQEAARQAEVKQQQADNAKKRLERRQELLEALREEGLLHSDPEAQPRKG